MATIIFERQDFFGFGLIVALWVRVKVRQNRYIKPTQSYTQLDNSRQIYLIQNE
ncbi:hypothetical protein [Brasilonema bromeliae]|uniref:hypothetical protein n=1 Tax=Brasilonema bromeliae TaxID=383615 RepID=UPI00145E737D|nr:hypothetical protein [Brasilonema bromeliae]